VRVRRVRTANEPGAFLRVLIADDDEIARVTLQKMLVSLGHEPVAARDGAEAWDVIQCADSPSLMILDWQMPGLEGIEICRKVRGDAERRLYQYIIMLTARDRMEDLVESLEAGADDFLRKPFDVRELRARVHAGERILAARDELRARATFDALTGLLNRATIMERLEREVLRARARVEPLSVVLVDLDEFKRVNDTHGHLVGDEVLRQACKRLSARMRPYDELGRYGGEEFLAVLPGCSASCGLDVADRMRDSLGMLPLDTSAGALSLTASFGVATIEKGQSRSIPALLEAADAALYQAKRNGRNRVASLDGVLRA
jgi:diguanylate cyclase (GGDEF)-like protein